MKFLDCEPTTKDFPKTQTQEPQQFRIGFGIMPDGKVGFSLWKVGFAIGPMYSGSLEEPHLSLEGLKAAVASSQESK